MAATTFASSAVSTGAFSLTAAMAAALNTLYVWQSRFEQREQLKGMEAHTMADMRLSRADINKEVRKAFWQA